MRARRRIPVSRTLVKAATAAVLILTVGLGLTWLCRPRPSGRLLLTPQTVVLPADGGYHPAFHLELASGKPLADAPSVTGLRSRVVMIGNGTASLEVQSPSVPGERRIRIEHAGSRPTFANLTFAADSSDHFGDGTPEFLRLHTATDRAAFRGWFTALADFAATVPPNRLPKEIDDCAALLRWCYRNALHVHDEAWQATVPFAFLPPLPSVQQYVWPNTSLGTNLFRVRTGAYTAQDRTDGAFAQFADARALMQRNTLFLSRDLRAAMPGDLLFYRQLGQNSPFHSMILTGRSAQWVVYDTGPIGRGPGEIRRVLVADLLHHPDRQWRPTMDNENFLGVYRWNILRQDRR